MRVNPDESLENFIKITRQEWPKLTESDTRSKIIDPIFITCLNWKEEDIDRENSIVEGYVDYTFKYRGKNKFIIEAKNNGVSFNIPIKFGNNRRFKIDGILSKDKTIKNAIIQARRYCFNQGVRFGIITNGSAYIFFEAYVLGEDWRNGNCIVYYNLDDIRRNYIDFLNLISKDAVEQNSLTDIISRNVKDLTYDRVVDGMHYKNEIQPRNNLYISMSPIMEYAFAEITDNKRKDMLTKCYVYENIFLEVDNSLKSKFSTDMPPVELEYEIKKIIQTEDTAGDFLTDYYRHVDVLKNITPEPSIFLLLGRIGSGKTTFIHRFFNIVLSEEERKNVMWFYVTFRDAPIKETEIKEYIYNGIIENFMSKYYSKVKHILDRYEYKEIMPTIEHITKLFLILRTEGYYLSLVIDNVDQHKTSDPIFHEKIFLETNYIAKVLRTLTIIALREESFYGSTVGVFDAYYINRYTISSPNFKKLILYRLEYIIGLLTSSSSKLTETITINYDLTPHKQDIIDFLTIVKDSIKRSGKGGISEFISSISGSNMRRALDLFKIFLISGNTKINEMLEKYRDPSIRSYYIAYHQFVKSIMLRNYRYFEERDMLMNIYDFNTEHSNSHFLKLKILKYALERITNDSPKGKGYISINILVQEAFNVSISKEAVIDSLDKLAKFGLIILDTRSRMSSEGASYFKITECGRYYLDELSHRFVYVDLIIPDTPITDYDLVNKFRETIYMSELFIRFKRTREFISYLRHMEDREFQINPEYRLSSLGKYMFGNRLSSKVNNKIAYIEKRVRQRKQFTTY